MGKHLIILGVSGSLDPQRMPLIIGALCKAGLQIRHASARYDGNGLTEMAVGTTEDLTTELASLGHKLEVVTSGAGSGQTATVSEGAAEGVSLEALYQSHKESMKLLVQIDQKCATLLKGAKAPKGGAAKKEGGGGDEGAGQLTGVQGGSKPPSGNPVDLRGNAPTSAPPGQKPLDAQDLGGAKQESMGANTHTEEKAREEEGAKDTHTEEKAAEQESQEQEQQQTQENGEG